MPRPRKPSKPRVAASGRHPYTILAQCMDAARRAGWSEAQIKAFRERATLGPLSNVLTTCANSFDLQGN